MGRRIHRDLSDSQANAEALARRSLPYAAQNQTSAGIAYDYRRRQPRDLREAVQQVRRAYADEVPTKLHDGPDAIGDDGTPRMTPTMTSYVFGNPLQTDAGRHEHTKDCGKDRVTVGETIGTPPVGHMDDCPAHPENYPMLSFYLFPFQATLSTMQKGDEASRRRAAIVSHVTIGSRGPQEAALAEGIPAWAAKCVAEDAIRSFLRRLSDVKVNVVEGVA